MKTDIDRLHDVVMGKIQGRYRGETFSKIHELASNIELGLDSYGVVRMTHYRDMDMIMPMLYRIFEERGLPRLNQISKNKGKCNEVIIHFVANKHYDEWTRGRDNYFEVDMRYYPIYDLGTWRIT